MNEFEKVAHAVENKIGEGFGELEKLVGHPLYFVSSYRAKVSALLTRGSWPSSEELKGLAAEGFRTIVNLCAERSQDFDVAAARMDPRNIPIIDNTPPGREQLSRFLRILDEGKPVYVHCEQGKGRTGCMAAGYRVLKQGWKAEAALKEAEGFGLAFPAQKDWILGLA